MHGDIIPISEFLGDTAVAWGIVFFEIVQRGVGEHHAEAESVVGAVALVDRDLGVRPLLSKQDRRIETGRSSPDDRDLHGKPPEVLSDHPNYFKPKAFCRQELSFIRRTPQFP